MQPDIHGLVEARMARGIGGKYDRSLPYVRLRAGAPTAQCNVGDLASLDGGHLPAGFPACRAGGRIGGLIPGETV